MPGPQCSSLDVFPLYSFSMYVRDLSRQYVLSSMCVLIICSLVLNNLFALIIGSVQVQVQVQVHPVLLRIMFVLINNLPNAYSREKI